MHIILKTFWILTFLLVAGCSEPTLPEVKLQDDVATVANGFVRSLGKNDFAAARKFVAPSSLEDFDTEFEERPKYLDKLLHLKPVFVQKKSRMLSGPFDNDVTVIYAAKGKKGWNVMELNLFWLEEEKPEVEAWTFQTNAEMPQQLRGQQFATKIMQFGMPVAGLVAALFLGFLVWLIRRKPQVFSPDTRTEERRPAVTSRRNESEL